MPKITFTNQKNEKTEVEIPEGANLRDEALKVGLTMYSGMNRYLNCHGLGLCGTCRVFVKQGMEHLSPKTLRERFNLAMHPMSMLAALGHENEIRLSCQVRVLGDCIVETTPAFNWSGENFWQKPYPNK